MKIKYILTILFVLATATPVFASETTKEKPAEKPVILKPNVAGQFYPSNKEELKKDIEKYISDARVEKLEKIRAIIAPHAGYVYSGPTAGFAYAAIKGGEFNNVLVIGPTHHEFFEGISIPKCDAVETPLGEVPMSPLVEKLMKEKIFVSKPEVHDREHSVEVQIPFLQTTLKDFSIVPMVTGEVEPAKAAEIIAKYLDDKTLIVVSTDLSHYLDYETAQGIDKATVRMILEMNTDLLELPNFQACGKTGILILLKIAEMKGWTPKLLDLRNSGDTAGEKDRVVGYASIAFIESDEKKPKPASEKEVELTAQDGEYLVKLARKSLEYYLDKDEMLKVEEKEVPESCRGLRGCFVTLTKSGQLRGCIGSLIPDKNLYENVIENAVNAAINDPRFTRVKKEELDSIHVEVSVLSLPKKLVYKDDKDLLEKLRPNVDGVILTFYDRAQSTFLPQVWEQIPDKKEFLTALTKKASYRLPEDAWKQKYAKVFTYQAQVFEEKKTEEKKKDSDAKEEKNKETIEEIKNLQ